MKDLSGQQFHDWTVIGRDVSRKGSYWLCRCSCGNVCSVASSNLLSGGSKRCRSCANVYRNHQTWVNRVSALIGTHVGEWLVLGIDEDHDRGHNGGRLICQCSCGRICSVSHKDLIRGESNRCRECGKKYVVEFHHNRRNDLTGKVFGHWHVLRVNDEVVRNGRGNPVLKYYCQCDLCGDIYLVNAVALTSGRSTRCYKCSAGRSRMEEWTQMFFNKFCANIESQVSFDDLTGLGGGLLSYDFGVYDDCNKLLCLIECQGRQHYEPVKLFGGQEQFEIQMVHDDLKRDYAKKLQVPLMEIPYVYDTYAKLEEFFLQHGFGSCSMYMEHGPFEWMALCER